MTTPSTPTSRSSAAAPPGSRPPSPPAASAGRSPLFDDGTYRNATVSHMHNVLTHDGTPPADFRAAARRELTAYDTVSVREERVETVERDGDGFRLTLASGDVITAYAVVLATGVRDELPPIPGLQEVWGDLAAQCPFCHGFEFAGQRIGIIGAAAAGHSRRCWGRWRASSSSSTRARRSPRARRSTAPVVDGPDDCGRAARATGCGSRLDDGSTQDVAVLFVVPTLHQSAPFAEQLGLELNPSGAVRIDEFGRTSVPGVTAGGDLAHLAAFPMPMASVVMASAAGQMAGHSAIAGLLARA